MAEERTLLILAVTLFFGVIIPQLFRRVELPFVTSIVLVGALFGPSGFELVAPDPTMEIFGFVGAAFHMLLAGMKAETLHLGEDRQRLGILFAATGLMPLGVGAALTRYFGYPWETAVFMGVVYAASSLVVVFSQVEHLRIEGTRLGVAVKSLVVVTDLAAVMGVYLLVTLRSPGGRFPTPILVGLLISSVVVLRMFLPEVMAFLFARFPGTDEAHEARLRLVISVLLFILLMYSALDVHPVVAAFLVGFALAGSPGADEIRKKLHTIAYALFVPIYFFIVGVHLDLVAASVESGYVVVLATVGALLASKAVGGYIGGRSVGFSSGESALLGISATTKLTFAIAFAYVALALDLVDSALYSAIVLVSVMTTVVNPLLLSRLSRRVRLHD